MTSLAAWSPVPARHVRQAVWDDAVVAELGGRVVLGLAEENAGLAWRDHLGFAAVVADLFERLDTVSRRIRQPAVPAR